MLATRYRLKPKQRGIAQINVVPYIDVMLVLLVIFMVTAPNFNQGVEVSLPSAKAKKLPENSQIPIIVSVDSQGQLYLNIASNPGEVINEQQLQAEVIAALQRENSRAVLVKADKHVAYTTVLEVMVLLQHAGVPTVGLQTTND